ncbi:MAG: L-serine dehydratase [Pontimonas sp.]|jgi:L-serine dehydratase
MTHIGALELFTIGIGPSSSHTVGPMRAARAFVEELQEKHLVDDVSRVHISLYGSLAATGEGHGTNNALIRGLALDTPERCDPQVVRDAFGAAMDEGHVALGSRRIPFSPQDLTLHPLTRLPHHSNGMRFEARDPSGANLLEALYFSVGGGFIERADQDDTHLGAPFEGSAPIPYPAQSALQLMAQSHESGLSIAEITLANDISVHGESRVHQKLDDIWRAMKSCIDQGLAAEGILPGRLKVARRAHTMASALTPPGDSHEHSAQWLQAYAIAVNEENAAGGRVVTAPTNGAAGIIPAVAYWASCFYSTHDEDIARVYLPTAAAIGSLYKKNASISGAEAGCQGEVGSACSMAAGALTALMGGTVEQIENAAEIAMEHNLGLTCDPVGGFVQMPCIERNAIAAGTAVAAMRLAMLGDGSHKISLDTVIETMRQTGLDMSSKYKETSMGGLAVNVVEC